MLADSSIVFLLTNGVLLLCTIFGLPIFIKQAKLSDLINPQIIGIVQALLIAYCVVCTITIASIYIARFVSGLPYAFH